MAWIKVIDGDEAGSELRALYRLWGTETHHSSRDLVILVDQTTESRPSTDAGTSCGSAAPRGGFGSREIYDRCGRERL
jgi:hypothetical protein